MPIIKTAGVITYTAPEHDLRRKKTGVHNNGDFAICGDPDQLKQIQFDPNGQDTDTTTTIKGGAISADVEITLPATSGTLGLAGTGLDSVADELTNSTVQGNTDSNTANSAGCFAGGGTGSANTANGVDAVALGQNCASTNAPASLLSGDSNTASFGASATFMCGRSNTAAGVNSLVGGRDCHSGASQGVSYGRANTTSHDNSVSMGHQSTTQEPNQLSHGGTDNHQYLRAIYGASVADAGGAGELQNLEASTRIIIQDESVMMFRVTACAIQTTGAGIDDTAGFDFTFLAKRINAGAPTIVAGGGAKAVAYSDAGASAWTVTPGISGNDIKLDVVNTTTETVVWTAKIEAVQTF